MTIPPRFMDDLRNRLTLSEVIGKRIPLKNAGREFKGCCPFHKEKTASFTVNNDKQFYHCFGCGAHGDVIGFVMRHDNLSFIEAIEMLAAQAGLKVPQQRPEDVREAQKQKGLYSLIEDTTRFFEEQLRTGNARAALGYLHERDIRDEVIESFRIGYAPADGDALYQFLKKEGYEDAQMVEAGVTRKSTRNNGYYSFFRDRIIFPVSDRRGRVIAFGGRILPEHLRPDDRSGREPPKYINSSDTPLFHKGRMLYGESHARQAAREGQKIIVVEGYMDVIACAKAGYRGAVAPLGTALTEEQILALWRMIPGQTKTPVLCFDGDNAGRRAAARACERLLPLLRPDHSVKLAFLPEGQDPDSLLRGQGKLAFQAVIDSAIPLVDFIWSLHTAEQDFDTPESRAGLKKRLEGEAARIGERSVQRYYQQAFSDRLYQTFGGNYKKSYGRGTGKKGGVPPVKLSRPSFSREMLQKQILLAALLNHPGIFGSIEDEVGTMMFNDTRLDSLRQATFIALSDSPGLDIETLRTHLIEQGFEEELGFVLNNRVYTHGRFAAPGTDEEDVLDKWRDVWKELSSFSYKVSFSKELKEKKQELVHDNFSLEAEKRLLAMHDVYKAVDE